MLDFKKLGEKEWATNLGISASFATVKTQSLNIIVLPC